MNVLTRAGIAWKALKGSVTHPAELLGMVEMLMRSHEAVSGASVNPATAMRVAAWNASVNVVSETLGMLPVMVFKKSTDGRSREPQPNHPLMRLLKQPNPWQNRMEFIEMLTAHACNRGNGYAFINKVRNAGTGKDFIAELLPLHPDAVEVKIRADKMPEYVYTPIERGVAAAPITIPWEQMFHLRYKSLNGYVGISPISVARDVIGMGITLQNHSGALFKRGAHTGGVLTHPETLDDAVAKRIRESWQETYGGSANAGKVVVLEEGMTYAAVGMNMKDAQYIDTKKMNRVEIASILRVPPYKIGAVDKMSYNSMEQAALEFVSDCLLPWITRWELTFGRDLVFFDDFFTLRFDLKALLRGDLKSMMDAFKVGIESGILCPDDAREWLDMNPIEGGKGKIHLQPMNFVPLGTEPPKEKPPSDTPPAPAKSPYEEALLALMTREPMPPTFNVPVTVDARTTVEPGAVQNTFAEGAIKTDVKGGDTSVDIGGTTVNAEHKTVPMRTVVTERTDSGGIQVTEQQPIPKE